AFRAAEHGDGGAYRAVDSSGSDAALDSAAGSWPAEDLGRTGGISGAVVDDDELDDEIWSNSFSEEDVSLLDLAVPKNLADSRRGKSGTTAGRKGHDRAVLDAEDDWLDSSDSPVGGEAVSSTNTGAGGSVYNLGALTTIMGIVLVGLGLFLCGGGFFFFPASSYISALLVAVLAHFISTKTGTQLSTAVYFGSAIPIAAGAFAQGNMLGASASLVILVMAQHFTIHAALGRAALGGVAALAGGAAAALLDPLPALRAICSAATGATAAALGADAFARTGLLKAAALLLAAAPDPAPYSPNSRTWGLLAALIALFVISAVLQTLLARRLAAATADADAAADQAASPAAPAKASDAAAASVNPAALAWAEWDSKQHTAASAATPVGYNGYPGAYSAAPTGLRAPPSPAYLHAPASPSIHYAVAPASPAAAAAAAAPGFAYVAAPAGPPQPSAYGAPPASPMPAMLLPPPFPTSPVPTAAALPAHPGAPAVLYPATMSSSTPLYPHPQAAVYAPAPTYAPVPTYAPAPAVYYVSAPSPQPPPPQALNNNGGGGGWVVPAVAGAAVGLGVGGLAGHIMTAGAQGDRAAAATAGRRGGGDRERFYEADDGGGGDDGDDDDDDDDF
ncbi:hypothetical protein HK405_002888, partial [Cladochytrium tenue]